MSRIGKQPINIPSDVGLKIEKSQIEVTGKKGSLCLKVDPSIEIISDDKSLKISPKTTSKKDDAYSGLVRTLINNMVIGVTQGFKSSLMIEGVGYKVGLNGKTLNISVGYSSTVDFVLPEKVNATLEGTNKIVLDSIDKELLGLTASKIRKIRPPEPYKGKGIRYENEHIVRKVGKAGGKK